MQHYNYEYFGVKHTPQETRFILGSKIGILAPIGLLFMLIIGIGKVFIGEWMAAFFVMGVLYIGLNWFTREVWVVLQHRPEIIIRRVLFGYQWKSNVVPLTSKGEFIIRRLKTWLPHWEHPPLLELIYADDIAEKRILISQDKMKLQQLLHEMESATKFTRV